MKTVSLDDPGIKSLIRSSRGASVGTLTASVEEGDMRSNNILISLQKGSKDSQRVAVAHKEAGSHWASLLWFCWQTPGFGFRAGFTMAWLFAELVVMCFRGWGDSVLSEPRHKGWRHRERQIITD